MSCLGLYVINNNDVSIYSDNCTYWIGLYKETPRPQEKTGWLWLDGQPYDDSLDLWARHNPDGRDIDKCATLVGLFRKWLDRQCNGWLNGFICKHSKWIY